MRFNNLCTCLAQYLQPLKFLPLPLPPNLPVHRRSYGVSLINFRHVDTQPRLIRMKMRKPTKVAPERGHVCAPRHVSSREDARGELRRGGDRRRRSKKPGKLVTLLTDGRLLKCPLKVLLLGARPDEVWLGASSRRRRPHLGRHGDADFCSLFLPSRAWTPAENQIFDARFHKSRATTL